MTQLERSQKLEEMILERMEHEKLLDEILRGWGHLTNYTKMDILEHIDKSYDLGICNELDGLND